MATWSSYVVRSYGGQLSCRPARCPPCPAVKEKTDEDEEEKWKPPTSFPSPARPPALPFPSFHLHRRDLYHAQRTLPNSIRDSAPACAPASTRRVDRDSYRCKLQGVARALVQRTTQGEHIPLQSTTERNGTEQSRAEQSRAELSWAVRRGAFGDDRQTVGLDGGYSASCVGLSLQEWPWPSQGAQEGASCSCSYASFHVFWIYHRSPWILEVVDWKEMLSWKFIAIDILILDVNVRSRSLLKAPVNAFSDFD